MRYPLTSIGFCAGSGRHSAQNGCIPKPWFLCANHYAQNMIVFLVPQPARDMPKRKSGGAQPAKAKASKKDSGLPAVQPDALRLPHLKLFNTWVYLGHLLFVCMYIIVNDMYYYFMSTYVNIGSRQDTIFTEKKTMDGYLTDILAKKEISHF